MCARGMCISESACINRDVRARVHVCVCVCVCLRVSCVCAHVGEFGCASVSAARRVCVSVYACTNGTQISHGSLSHRSRSPLNNRMSTTQ